MKIAERVNKINPSFTLQMATKAAEMRSKGIDVINFSVGEPDFNTPRHIRDAAKKALDQGYTKYTAGPGMIELREAICEKLNRENKISYVTVDDAPIISRRKKKKKFKTKKKPSYAKNNSRKIKYKEKNNNSIKKEVDSDDESRFNSEEYHKKQHDF